MTTPDPEIWTIQPLIDVGYTAEDIRGIADWLNFEAIAADTEGRSACLAEIKHHMNAKQRAALDETVRRIRQRNTPDDAT